MAKRKSVPLVKLIADVNRMLEVTPDSATTEREALAGLLHRQLMDAGVYAGFRYLPSEYLPAEERTVNRVLRGGYDETRRQYIVHQYLTA